jgi:hypothetical protein
MKRPAAQSNAPRPDSENRANVAFCDLPISSQSSGLLARHAADRSASAEWKIKFHPVELQRS